MMKCKYLSLGIGGTMALATALTTATHGAPRVNLTGPNTCVTTSSEGQGYISLLKSWNAALIYVKSIISHHFLSLFLYYIPVTGRENMYDKIINSALRVIGSVVIDDRSLSASALMPRMHAPDTCIFCVKRRSRCRSSCACCGPSHRQPWVRNGRDIISVYTKYTKDFAVFVFASSGRM